MNIGLFVSLALFKCIYSASAELENSFKEAFQGLRSDLQDFGKTIKTFVNGKDDEMEHEIVEEFLNTRQNVMIGVKPFTGIRFPVMKMLQNIAGDRVSNDEQVGSIVSFLTDLISEGIENTRKISPAEMVYSNSQYMCMTDGKVSGLKSIKHVGTKIVQNPESLDIYLTYKFRRLHVHYNLFYFEILLFPSITGALDIKFYRNKIELVLNIPKFKYFVEKLVQKECVIRLKDFNVKELKYRSSRLTDTHNESYSLLSSMMDRFLKLNQSMMDAKFEARVLEEIRRSLKSAENLVCNDDEFEHLIVKKGGSLVNDFDSDNFKLHCGSG